MDRCTCTPCGPMLGPLLQRVAPRLKLLRLTGVDGLGNDDLVRLAGASRLSSLTVSAPRNEAGGFEV